MFSPLRNRFGIPGVIAVIALVFAMFGGAYAATQSGKRHHKKKSTAGLNAKQKKEVKSIAKGFQGSGPAGPVGPQGPAGANGSDGANGQNGANGAAGADGATILSGTVNPTSGVGSSGDFYIRTDTSQIWGPKAGTAWGSPTSLKGANGADGADGSPWTAGGTLPSGATETGVWSFGALSVEARAPDRPIWVPISFSVPLAAELTHDPDPAVSHVHYIQAIIGAGEELNEETFEPEPSTHCDGTAAAPSADPGHLCVYLARGESTLSINSNVTKAGTVGEDGVPGASTTGAILTFAPAGAELPNQWAFGTFAVTAP